ncbi:unnamed protein product [Calypogeia fissa]
MSSWEYMNCPWYVETNRWSTPFNSKEVSNLRFIEKGGVPVPLRIDATVQGEGDSELCAKAVESNISTFVLGKVKARKGKRPDLLTPKKQGRLH